MQKLNYEYAKVGLWICKSLINYKYAKVGFWYAKFWLGYAKVGLYMQKIGLVMNMQELDYEYATMLEKAL